MPVTDARPRLTSGDFRPPKQCLVTSRRRLWFLLAPALHLVPAMIQRVGAFIFVSSLFGVGCGVGDDNLEPIDPNPNGVVCTDAFKATGTWTAGTPMRDPVETPTGCWPVGQWRFTLAIDPSDESILDINADKKPDRCGAVKNTSIASFDASYSFTVNRVDDGDGWIESYILEGAVQQDGEFHWNDKVLYKLKVTEGGSGECEGNLELLSADRKSLWNLHPTLTGTAIAGTGDFTLYDEAKD